MAAALKLMRNRFDRLGLLLSGLCAVHCLATLALVALLGMSGGFLLDPALHRIGLGLAVAIGVIALGFGVVRHGRREPLALGAAGLTLMGIALLTGHGPGEAALTIAGVSLVALAHWKNVRHLA
jgi:hypothetical protein